MGYRSEVALTMKKEDILELLKQAMAQSDNGSAQNFLCYDKILDHQNGYASLYWDWVKWYEDYPEIAFVTQFYNDIVEKGGDISFKRIGESDDDYESEWSGDWGVCECVELVRKRSLCKRNSELYLLGGSKNEMLMQALRKRI